MHTEDAEQTRKVRHQISRRYVDSTLLDVMVLHGVIYLRGSLKNLATHRDNDLTQEMEAIIHQLRAQPGIRDVVWEAKLDAH